MRILHITTHLGGGVGTTVLGFINKNKSFEHEVLALGYTMDYTLEDIEFSNIVYKDHVLPEEIIKKIPYFDVILIHQWNHPLLYDFLVRNELPPCRLIMWGHTSGINAPNIYTEKILRYPDIFVFTTPLSYKTKDVEKQRGYIRVFDIWSTEGVDEYKELKKVNDGFVVGYIGTVGYSKLHKDFLEMCKEIINLNIPRLKFIVVGGLKHKEIEAEAIEMGIQIEFTGIVPKSCLVKCLAKFDVFGYPLSPHHYGTCDLALQIAMGAGVVPVVFNNGMESYMVKNKKTGIVVKNKREYVQAIFDLYNNINWRKQLSKNTREEAIKRFSLDTLNNEWEKVISKVLELPKTKKKWDIDNVDIKPSDIFLEALGKYGNPFGVYSKSENKNEKKINLQKIQELAKISSWQTETKGSVYNYHSYFPDDTTLSEWKKLFQI